MAQPPQTHPFIFMGAFSAWARRKGRGRLHVYVLLLMGKARQDRRAKVRECIPAVPSFIRPLFFPSSSIQSPLVLEGALELPDLDLTQTGHDQGGRHSPLCYSCPFVRRGAQRSDPRLI